ncbi:MAG: MBL fold metallo-hydrolase [Solobacterium sp.]|nr:MBL fold metallo-hydrolase [Solobacterium sp.]
MEKKLEKTYRCRKLMDGVYGITSSGVACYLIVGKKQACVIDTAYGFADLQAYVRKITDLPLVVINTHGHIDHTGGNFFFDVPVCIHEKDVQIYQRHNEPSFHRYMEKSLKLLNRIFFWRILVPKHPEKTDEGRMHFSNWRYVRDGDVFDLGNLSAQVIEIPGHTQGSIAVYFKEKKLLVTSDGANAATWLFLPESTGLSEYLTSLHRLETYDFETILTGHSLHLFTRKDLEAWIHVAEHPGFSHAKKQKGGAFAPGVRPLQVFAEDDPKHKGPSVMINPAKEGFGSER